LLKKLIVAQLLRKFPTFSGNAIHYNNAAEFHFELNQSNPPPPPVLFTCVLILKATTSVVVSVSPAAYTRAIYTGRILLKFRFSIYTKITKIPIMGKIEQI